MVHATGGGAWRVGPPPEAVTEVRAYATQATRKGWPYYTRYGSRGWWRGVESRATPRSGNGSPCLRHAGHPQGVALLYAIWFTRLVEGPSIVGPPLAGGLRLACRDLRLRLACRDLRLRWPAAGLRLRWPAAGLRLRWPAVTCGCAGLRLACGCAG